MLVSWTPPSGEPAVTGYIIYYQQDGGQRLSLSAGPNATTATFTGLIVHVRTTFSITMVVASSTLPSVETAAQTITITLNGECIHSIPLHIIILSFLSPQLSKLQWCPYLLPVDPPLLARPTPSPAPCS